MELSDAIRKRIYEIANEKGLSIYAICLNGNLTSSTVFDFLNGKSGNPSCMTIKKICVGAGITLEEFFAKDYFNSTDDVYK